jgi:hypothetical protein
MLKVLVAILLLSFSIAAQSAELEPGAVSALVTQAKTKNLAHHPYWLALLHYQGGALGGAPSSEVITPDFFNSPRGAVNPDSELEATLLAFFRPANDLNYQDEHAQCRFVARYRWLRKVLDWSKTQPPPISCPRFSAWAGNNHISSVSLIFATGYFSNPASFYGHLLLKFNTQQNLLPADLLNESMNFGAIVPDNENPVRYIVKGVFGQYDAAFSSTGYYRLNHIYAENELRDMWEYELALSPDEVNQITTHSWELLRARFKYSFFNKNCAYRMAELLELVVKEPLLSKLQPWSVPSSVFDHLVQVQHDGKPLVRRIKRIPSRVNRYREQFHRLDGAQQSVVVDFAKQRFGLAQTRYPELTTQDQVAVVDTLMDYYQYRIVAERDNATIRSQRRDLMIERARLPAIGETGINTEQAENTTVLPPHAGSPPGLIRPGIAQNNKLGAGTSLQLRPVYFDNLGLDIGRVDNANLTMFDITALHTHHGWQVRNFDLVNVEHMNAAATPVPGDGGWAWRIKFGAESVNLACDHCLVAHVTGGLGKAINLTDDVTCYAMLNGIVQSQTMNSGTLGAFPVLGLLAKPVHGWKSSLTLSRHLYLNGSSANAPQIAWSNRFGTARDWDIRINYNYNIASEWQIAISSYW